MVKCNCVSVDSSKEMVGRRVAVGKSLGTVRYVGPVPPAQGTWLGVEWDDPDRGKHDGTHNGHHYFYTKHPTSGSFVRIEKADFGRSCVSAIKERYASNQLTLTAEELQDLQKAMNAPHLEMVGFEKINKQQSCFSALQVICLHEHQVSSAGEGLAGLCPDTREAYLSLNLLSSWNQVADITVHFPKLQFLNLSENRLEVPESPEILLNAFINLSHLVLGNMDYTWDQICNCSKMWPQIQQLQIQFNNVSCLDLPGDTLVNLTYLDLEGNQISQWEEVNKLGDLDQLETLNLCDLGLTNICLPPSQSLFKNLQCLMLSNNKIEKWEHIAELDKLPKLTELKLSHNPVLENLSVDTIHYKTICRIGSLKILNRQTILRGERRGAEMDYLKDHGKEWLESANDENLRERFLLQHPRFPTLVKKHGAAGEDELKVVSTSLNSDLVQVKLSSPEKTVTKKLYKRMMVGNLIILVKRLFNIDSSEIMLTYHSTKNTNIRGEMDSLLQTLDYYSIEDGDEISVRW